MGTFLSLHLGTIIVGLLLLLGVACIIIHLIRAKRKGKCVGCDCAACPSRTDCDKK